MTDFLDAVARGLPLGCIFALVAVGLVLTYRTAGVFNLAFGAQAFVSAAVYFDTRSRHDWPIWAAFVFSVLIVAPLLGYVLDRSLFRHLRSASSVAKLVTTLGLLVAIPQITRLWFGAATGTAVRGIWPWADEFGRPRDYHFGDVVINGDRLAAVVITVVAVGLLSALFRWSRLGLRMRATVESPRMTELAGIRADRISSVAWMMSSVFAGMAGVLLAPLFNGVNDADFFFLILAALAAAAFGSLQSIPMTFAGGLILGVGYQLLNQYLDPASILSTGLKPSLPFLALFLLLLFWPGLRSRREQADPLAGVDPPPPAPAATLRTHGMTVATRVLACVAILLMCVGVGWKFDDLWVLLFTTGVVYAVIFCSITVITGMAGLLSLSQASFAAIGAITTAQLVDAFGFQVLVAVLVGALLAALVGGLFALPLMRLDGLYLALATLAFAAMFQALIFPQDWAAGDFPDVPRPILGPFDFSSTRSYFFLVLVILGLVAGGILLVKRGTTGRYLDALRGSEVAAASIGIDPRRARVTAFALSAGIAGLGGGLLAVLDQGLSQLNYNFIQGLVWVVLVVTLGARSLQAAITAGITFRVFPKLLSYVDLGFLPDTVNPAVNANAVAFALFGLGALTYAKHPEGIIEHQTTRSMEFVNRVILRKSPVDEDDGGGAVEPGAAAA
jgi:branched-subunit amino acid ABC-type transport system permease component